MSQENKTPKFNIQNDKGDAPRKGPKFNIYWLYAVIAIVLLSAQFWKLAPIYTSQPSKNSSKKC